MMPKQRRDIRWSTELLARVDAWRGQRELTFSAAVHFLLAAALLDEEQPVHDQKVSA